MNEPTIEDLECLIHWEKGTVGWGNDRRALETLLGLCKEEGFGRIPQLASWIEDIWRDPSKMDAFNKMKNDQLVFMRAYEKDEEDLNEEEVEVFKRRGFMSEEKG